MASRQSNGNSTLLRVAMLGSFPPQSQGIQNYCGDLVQALSELCEVTAIGYAKMYPSLLFPGVKTPMDPTSKKPQGPGLTVLHKLTYYNPFGWMWAALTTPADVFHVQWWSLPLLPVTLAMIILMKLRGKRIVVTVHNILPHESKGVFVSATKAVCRFADRVLVHGKNNVRQFIAHYGIPETTVRNVAIGMNACISKLIPMQEARRELRIPQTTRTILSFGIIRPYKGVSDLLEALPKVASEVPEVRLIIAGKPWTDWAPYQARIDELNLAERLDLHLDYIPTEKVPVFFASADVVVVPYTHFNAQSAVAAQSISFKRPTIVSDVGGLPECVDNDPNWIVPPSDPDALAARLIEFFRHEESQSAAFNELAQRVLDKFSWPRIAERHLQIYTEAE